MFNENFSFGSSPHPGSLAFNIEECTSAEISPFTSRCSSPHSSQGPAPRRDSRFDAYRSAPRHPSITSLTAQLQSHALTDTEMHSPSPPPSDIASPSDFTTLDDEGYCEGPDTPATTVSELSYILTSALVVSRSTGIIIIYDASTAAAGTGATTMPGDPGTGPGHAYRRMPPVFVAAGDGGPQGVQFLERTE
ncbi:hypothetical protein AYO20_00873 [Fonsecaea nubica]|uniref:Uncharacterized protein n=1 Tax=Fonsecaea nubica TaxID=856822 RepID=A0A178DCJ1_9EURO|nr:hypothetical protein AYO20_00873 [Fonsecaea nubica]OAL39960.1 hypothetical protein AYO20_00873 [Fonsecaea nubica]